MIVPPDVSGVAFSDGLDGDVRNDPEARTRFSHAIGIPTDWAWVGQVHGSEVVHATRPGRQGEADALWTTTRSLPVAVFTADCLGVVLSAPEAVGVAHAGWKGTRLGIVSALVEAMTDAGHRPTRAVIGPGIGPCCFEVGPEVADQFNGYLRTTTWGTTSVDLFAAVEAQLLGIPVVTDHDCTRHDERFFSHRRDHTLKRQVALGWVP